MDNEPSQLALTGPYLKAAMFCESAIEGKDGTLSLIRVIDRLTTTAAGKDAPIDMPPVNHVMTAVLMLISGQALGRHDLRITSEGPSGETKEIWSGTMQMEGGHKGQNLLLNLNMQFQHEGVYWFTVTIDDRPITKMPFQVMYMRVSGGITP